MKDEDNVWNENEEVLTLRSARTPDPSRQRAYEQLWCLILRGTAPTRGALLAGLEARYPSDWRLPVAGRTVMMWVLDEVRGLRVSQEYRRARLEVLDQLRRGIDHASCLQAAASILNVSPVHRHARLTLLDARKHIEQEEAAAYRGARHYLKRGLTPLQARSELTRFFIRLSENTKWAEGQAAQAVERAREELREKKCAAEQAPSADTAGAEDLLGRLHRYVVFALSTGASIPRIRAALPEFIRSVPNDILVELTQPKLDEVLARAEQTFNERFPDSTEKKEEE